ncbi:MAG: TonB-dependent receptor [Crocinitomicaceae bacterium]|nr:TonB-dependent receptor [Crocinitomicaceae bacterium]|tara:strand:- start:12822 stop:15143 length:2322 start_codon:yes stop_codon:yes gene_type:complete
MRPINFVLLSIALLAISLTSVAQKGGVKGFVYNKETREPIIFTNAYLQGTGYGAATDVNGFYSISKVPDGTYTLMVSYLGFDTAKVEITITRGGIVSQNLFISESSVELDIIDISAEKQERQTEVRMSVTKITPTEIKKLPTVGGEADFAQYLQVIPGVIFTGDQGGQLYIRGGSPVQNKILMDGMIIYNAFHSIGLFSVFDADIMRSADVYTGGFGAEYGGRISSIMDITTREGNKKHFGGKIAISTFGAKALLEGPLKKPKSLDDGSISYMISAKTSYLDQTSKSIYSYVDTNGLPYTFNDFYGKISFGSGGGSKADIFGFGFTDNARYTNGTSLNWKNFGGGGKFIILPKSSSAILDGNFAYSKYTIAMNEPTGLNRESGIKGFNMGLNSTYFFGSNEFKFGVDIVAFTTNFSFNTSSNRQIIEESKSTELGLYGKYKWRIGDKLIIDPSVRLQFYATLNVFSPEPRIGIKYNLTDNIRIKGAAGMYSQNLIAANSDRDVVNLFYGFIASPENLQSDFTDQNGKKTSVKNELQKANHYILGAEWDVLRNITLNVEGYYKQFTQLVNVNRNKIFDDTPENEDRPDIYKKTYIVEKGDAYGVDISLKYDYKRYYIWAVYSLGNITRWDGIREYNPVFNRVHNVNLVGAVTLGKNLDWEFNLRYNYGSGFPFTQTAGFYEQLNLADNTADPTVQNGTVNTLYGDINQGRLPYYSRLDANIKKTFTISSNVKLEANVGVTNMLNQENIFFFDRLTYTQVNQLPFMPNASLSLTW